MKRSYQTPSTERANLTPRSIILQSPYIDLGGNTDNTPGD